jgi:hypothetical protein
VRAVVLAPLVIAFAMIFLLAASLAPTLREAFDVRLDQTLPITIIATAFACVTFVRQELVLRVALLGRQRQAQAVHRAQRLQGETEFLLLNILPVHVIQRCVRAPAAQALTLTTDTTPPPIMHKHGQCDLDTALCPMTRRSSRTQTPHS